MYPAPGILERIGPDWDWIWIDAQHGDLDFREATHFVRACHLIGRPGLVRVPGHDPCWIGKALDAGAAGVIVPLVESVEEARAMVRAAKFPPLGNRSYGGRRVTDTQTRAYYRSANTDTALILQVESSAACSLAGELAALDGVDGLFLGPDDLLIREGHDVNAPKTEETIGWQMRAVAEVCQAHGKWSVCVSVTDATLAMARKYGFRMVVGGSDVGFLASGSKETSAKARASLTQKGASEPEGPATLY